MKHVSIVVPRGAILSGIEMARHVFTEANDHLRVTGRQPVFSIHLVGAAEREELSNGSISIRMDGTIGQVQKTDLIIIPALTTDMDANLRNNQELMQWITGQYHRGAEVASLCVGTFLLAGTGLLDGRQCTTHWKAVQLFNTLFPGISIIKDRIITDEQGIYTSGGGISLTNLLIYLVEKYVGRDTAIYCSKFFQVDIDRISQSPFIIFQGQKNHGDASIRQAQEFIENNFHRKITVDKLAAMLALGRRSLERRFKKATSNTLNEYIQRVKIEAAKKQLEMSSRKINDIMYEVGYSDTKTFRHSFKSLTGLLPKEYRSKYNKREVSSF